MSTTNEAGLTLLTAGADDQEAPVNTAINFFDKSVGGELVHNFSSDANYTLGITPGSEEWTHPVIHLKDTDVFLTTLRNVIPPLKKKIWWIINDTAQSLLIKAATGTGATLASATEGFVRCDGTNIEKMVSTW